jgi:hypothetical protein
MAHRLDFSSPLSIRNCLKRLETLTKRGQVSVTEDGKTTRIVVDKLAPQFISDGLTYVNLKVRCHDRIYWQMGGVVFLGAIGKLEVMGDFTYVQVYIHMGLPVAYWEWLAQILWYLVILGLLALPLVGAIQTGDMRLWKLAGNAALFIALVYVVLARAYLQASAGLATILKRILTSSAQDGYVINRYL